MSSILMMLCRVFVRRNCCRRLGSGPKINRLGYANRGHINLVTGTWFRKYYVSSYILVSIDANS